MRPRASSTVSRMAPYSVMKSCVLDVPCSCWYNRDTLALCFSSFWSKVAVSMPHYITGATVKQVMWCALKHSSPRRIPSSRSFHTKSHQSPFIPCTTGNVDAKLHLFQAIVGERANASITEMYPGHLLGHGSVIQWSKRDGEKKTHGKKSEFRSIPNQS